MHYQKSKTNKKSGAKVQKQGSNEAELIFPNLLLERTTSELLKKFIQD